MKMKADEIAACRAGLDPPFDYGGTRSALRLLTPITASSGIEHRANSFGVPISEAGSQNRALRISSLLGSTLRFVLSDPK
jgi:hypothetical protein